MPSNDPEWSKKIDEALKNVGKMTDEEKRVREGRMVKNKMAILKYLERLKREQVETSIRDQDTRYKG